MAVMDEALWTGKANISEFTDSSEDKLLPLTRCKRSYIIDLTGGWLVFPRNGPM